MGLLIKKISDNVFKYISDGNEYFSNDAKIESENGLVKIIPLKSKKDFEIYYEHPINEVTLQNLENPSESFETADLLFLRLKDLGHIGFASSGSSGGATEATLLSIAEAVKTENTPAVDGNKGLAIFGIRKDADEPTGNDGDYVMLKLDEKGRLKVATQPASYTDVVGGITAIQATMNTPVAGGTVTANVDRASNVVMSCTGTFNTINVAFEASLEPTGENWVSIQAIRTNANIIETSTGNLSAAPIYAWEASVNAYARVRVRCLARATGTQSWRIKQGSYATEPIPGAQLPAGTLPVNVVNALTIFPDALMIPFKVNDIVTGALTASNTTAAITPTHGVAYQVMVAVTAVSGTNPTLDIDIEESDDDGSVWFKVYSFPRITAVSVRRSPVLPFRGNRIRYVQVVGGTTPSFTRGLNRLQSSSAVDSRISQIIDRLINLNTLLSVSNTLNTQNGTNRQIIVSCGAGATTAPVIQLEGSDDDGLTWYSIGPTVTGVVSGVAQVTTPNVHAQMVRARVVTAGVAATLNYILLKSF